MSVAETLKKHAATSQQKVFGFLSTARNVGKITQLWVSNQLWIQDATPELIQQLAEFPEVSLIKENEYIPLESFVVEKHIEKRENHIFAEWGIENIRATNVWAAAGGNQGEGVIISTIDTGVRGTHESLRNNYAGGWHDPYDGSTSPMDGNGHGTHTTGNIAGHGGIGVAPGSRWVACRGCGSSTCGNAQLLACAQWTICVGTNCNLSPGLISNSWGGGRGNTFYDAAVSAWHSSGQIPLFSNGNSGPGCNTANSPADSASGVLGIGSTTNTNALSSFSSKGPSIFATIKPDISAPGSSITSSYHTSDTAYSVLSGTSMACPHAAGAVALLLSKNPNLTYAQVRTLLVNGASTNLVAGNQACGGIPDSQYPNHSFGAGKVDALNSFNALVASMKE